jgi:hypothetical protein
VLLLVLLGLLQAPLALVLVVEFLALLALVMSGGFSNLEQCSGRETGEDSSTTKGSCKGVELGLVHVDLR